MGSVLNSRGERSLPARRDNTQRLISQALYTRHQMMREQAVKYSAPDACLQGGFGRPLRTERLNRQAAAH